MASPASSSIELRYSVRNLVREPADLDYVNQKLLSSGYNHTRIGCVTSGKPVVVAPTTKHPSPCRAEVLDVDEIVSDTCEILEQRVSPPSALEPTPPESLNLISPDSDILCESPDCPIKDFPHNIGRYFHNGEQYKNPFIPGLETTLAGDMEKVSNVFNGTVPPPEIVTAYINSTEEAKKAGLDLVRNYQKHHMWSPIHSAPSTPWPRHQYPDMHGLHGQMPPGNERYLTSNGITSIFDENLVVWIVDMADESDPYTGLGSFSFEHEPNRPLLPSDFEDSDDEDYVPFPPIRTPVSDESSTRPLLSPVTTQSDDEVYDGEDELIDSQESLYSPNNDSYISLSTMREVPQGCELMSEKLRLQEKILRQMADEALEQAEEGEDCLGRQGFNKFRTSSYANQDRELEVLLELQALDEERFRFVLLDDKQNNKGFSDAESRVLCDMLQREFQAMITNASRPYVPTGLPVTTAQLREKLNDMRVR